MKPKLQAVHTAKSDKLDDLTIEQIIGRDAAQKTERIIPTFSSTPKPEVRHGGLKEILKRLTK